MKKSSSANKQIGCAWLLTVLLAPIASLQIAEAAQLKEAQVTQVIKDVKVLASGAAPRPAAVRDEVRDGTTVLTGVESRAEVTFASQTLARLGADTVFSFNQGTGDMNLANGALLFQVPKGAGGAKIKTAAVTAATTGATGIADFHPHSYIKFLLLEGEVRIYLTNRVGESVLLHPGQILITKPDAKVLPEAAHFDIARFMTSCRLVLDFPPLASQALTSINKEILNQKNTRGLIPTNLVIFGTGTNVVLVDNADQKTTTKPRERGTAP